MTCLGNCGPDGAADFTYKFKTETKDLVFQTAYLGVRQTDNSVEQIMIYPENKLKN